MKKKKSIGRMLFFYVLFCIVWTFFILVILMVAAVHNGGSNSPKFFDIMLKIWFVGCVLFLTLIAIYYTNCSKSNIQKLLEIDFKSKDKGIELYKKIFRVLKSDNSEELARYRSVKLQYTADIELLAGVVFVLTVYLELARNIEIYSGLYELLAKFFGVTKTDIIISTNGLMAIIMIIIVLGALKVFTILNNEVCFIKVYEAVERDLKEMDLRYAEEIFKDDEKMMEQIRKLKQQSNE